MTKTLKTNAPQAIEEVQPSSLTLNAALHGFKAHAGVVNTAVISMVVSGALAYMAGYHFLPEGKRVPIATIDSKLDEILKSLNPTKGESTLAAYRGTAKRLYSLMCAPSDKQKASHPDVIRAYAVLNTKVGLCKDVDEAQAMVEKHLSDHGIDTLDMLKVHVGIAPSNANQKPQTAGDRIVSALKGLGTSIDENKADARSMAKTIASALPASIKPMAMAQASAARIVNGQELEILIMQTAERLAEIDVDLLDTLAVKLRKLADKAMKAQVKAKPAKDRKTETATVVA